MLEKVIAMTLIGLMVPACSGEPSSRGAPTDEAVRVQISRKDSLDWIVVTITNQTSASVEIDEPRVGVTLHVESQTPTGAFVSISPPFDYADPLESRIVPPSRSLSIDIDVSHLATGEHTIRCVFLGLKDENGKSIEIESNPIKLNGAQ